MSDPVADAVSHSLGMRIHDAILSGAVFDPSEFAGLSIEQGFAAQAEAFRRFGRPLPGIKLAMKGGVCHSAPLLSVSREDVAAFMTRLGVEVELAFVLARDIAVNEGAVERAAIVDAIGEVRIGVELVTSRYEGGSRKDPALGAADMMSNLGYVLGPELDRALLEEGALIGPLRVTIGGEPAYDAPAVHADADPLKSMVALASGKPLSPLPLFKAGQIVTTGSLCGLLPVRQPGQVEILLGGRSFVLTLK